MLPYPSPQSGHSEAAADVVPWAADASLADIPEPSELRQLLLPSIFPVESAVTPGYNSPITRMSVLRPRCWNYGSARQFIL